MSAIKAISMAKIQLQKKKSHINTIKKKTKINNKSHIFQKLAYDKNPKPFQA